MRDRSSVALAPRPVVWPPDDTEESVLGTSRHQYTIRTLTGGINEAAALAAPEGEPVPWLAGGQTMIRDFRRPDGSSYTTLPDVFVYPHPWDDQRGTLSVDHDGPPVLIIEVLSKETYESDLDLDGGKGFSFAQAGVREYLALDPTRAYAPEGGRGWRLVGGVYRPWRRDKQGRWASRAAPLVFGLEGVRAAVYAGDGHRILREGEAERALREQQRLRRDEVARARLEEREASEQALREALAEQARLRRRLEELERDR